MIAALRNSKSFSKTHIIIGEMSKESEWSETQIDEICATLENNNQVYQIIEDYDVFEFYRKLLLNKNCEAKMDSAISRVLERLHFISIAKEEKEHED